MRPSNVTGSAQHARSSLRVTVGSASLKWNAEGTRDGRSVARLWSDAALQAAYDAAWKELRQEYDAHDTFEQDRYDAIVRSWLGDDY